MLLFALQLLVILASAIPSHRLHHRPAASRTPRFGHHGKPAKYDEEEIAPLDDALLRLRMTPPSYLLGKILTEIMANVVVVEDARLVKRSDEKPLGVARSKPVHQPNGGAKPKPRKEKSRKQHHKRATPLDAAAPFNPLSYRFGKNQLGKSVSATSDDFETLPNGLPDTTPNVDPAILQDLLRQIIQKRQAELISQQSKSQPLTGLTDAEMLLAGGFWEWPSFGWPSWGGNNKEDPDTCPVPKEENNKKEEENKKADNGIRSYANGERRLREALRREQAEIRPRGGAMRVQDGIVHTWRGEPIIWGDILAFVPNLGRSGSPNSNRIMMAAAQRKPAKDKQPIEEDEPIEGGEPVEGEDPEEGGEPSKLPGWIQSICDYFDWDCSNWSWPWNSSSAEMKTSAKKINRREILSRAACALSLGALLTMVAISLWTILGIFFPTNEGYEQLSKDFADEEDEDDFADSRAEKGFSHSGILHDGCIKCGKN